MKYLLVAAAVCLFVSSQAAAEVVFRGSIHWTAVSNCKNERVPSDYQSVYHPNQPATNQNFSGLTHLYPFGGAAYDRVGAFTTAFQNVRGFFVNQKAVAIVGAQVRVTSRTPVTITNVTRFVTLNGQIKRPFGDPGINGGVCIVTFEAVYRRSQWD